MKIKIISILSILFLLLSTNVYAWMVQPSYEDFKKSRENLQKHKSTIKFVPAIDKIVEKYSWNRIFLQKLSYQILRAKAKITSKPIVTNRQRDVLAILQYLDVQVSYALYKIYKSK